MENTIVIILSSSLSNLIIAAIVYVFRHSIVSCFAVKIGHEFDKRIIDYQENIERRKKAAMVSELIAEWIYKPTDRKQ